MFAPGAQRDKTRTKFARQTLVITFDPQTREFICLPEITSQTIHLAARGLTKEALLGELAPLYGTIVKVLVIRVYRTQQ